MLFFFFFKYIVVNLFGLEAKALGPLVPRLQEGEQNPSAQEERIVFVSQKVRDGERGKRWEMLIVKFWCIGYFL